jgi:hypothetical protein
LFRGVITFGIENKELLEIFSSEAAVANSDYWLNCENTEEKVHNIL